MSIIASILRFAVGNILGVLALIGFLVANEARFADALWLAMLWLPISCFYCGVVISTSRCLIALQSSTLLVLLGLVVALFPFVSGLWPTYWAVPGFAALVVGIHVVILATISFGWWLSRRLIAKWV